MASGYYDFSGAFGNLNSSIDGLRKRWDQNEQKRTLAGLGQDWQAGNYDGAAQKAFASGDAATGIGLLKLGQAAKEAAADRDLGVRLFGGGLGTPPPSGRMALAGLGNGAPAPRTFERPVQFAETEEDTQRLEADMERRGQLGYGNPSLPAGMRNNNPGNIKFVSTRQAPGVVGPSQNTDQGDPQAVFNSPEAGMSAAYGLAMRKYGAGQRSAYDLIAKDRVGWTPGNRAAAENIARGVGVAPNEDLRLDDPQRAKAFMRALIAQEHGKSGALYGDDMIRAALGGGQPQQGAPVQVVQATQQPGESMADVPAQGAAQAQGFVAPGSGEVVPVDTIASNPKLRALALGLSQAKTEGMRASIKTAFDLELAAVKERQGAEGRLLDTQNKRLQNQKLERELAGDGARPMTAQERQAYSVPEGQPAYVKRNGDPAFGPAGTKIINEAQKIQGAEDKARVDINTKFLGALADSGPKVAQRMADMDVLASVIRDAPQTPVPDAQVFFDRLGAGLGLSKGELATRSDAMKAIIQRLAPAQREEGSGSTSDIEFKGMLASFPSLAATGEGRQMILTTIARQNEINRLRIEVADQWTQGEIPATEARKRIAQIDRASIFASDDEKKLIRKLAGTAKGGDLGASSGTMERTVNGTTYVQRGGQWYAKEGFQ